MYDLTGQNSIWGRIEFMVFQKLKKPIYFMGICAFCAFSYVPAAFADDPFMNIQSLSEANVKKFIEHTTDITTGNSQKVSQDKIEEYLDTHLEDGARFSSVMQYNIPGMPQQKAKLSLDKDGFMDSVKKGAEKIEGYETLVEIKEMKIASNKEKAFVKTVSTEYASMPVPTDTGDVEDVPIEGVSECTQILSLNSGVIQMFSAKCVTDINFLEY